MRARAALTGGYCIIERESQGNRDDRVQAAQALKRERLRRTVAIDIETQLRRCDEPLYHYTDTVATAGTIYGEHQLFVTPARRASGGTYPAGAYATKLWPLPGPNWDGVSYTQSTLSGHLFGNPSEPSSGWVMLCASRDPSRSPNPNFQPTIEQGYPFASPDYWHAPDSVAYPRPDNQRVVDFTPVPEGFGQNDMAP